MKFDVIVNGRPWRVALEPAGPPGRFLVSVKGRRREFDASWIDPETLSLVSVESPMGRVREIGLRPAGGADLDVVLSGKNFRATAVAEGQPGSGRPLTGAGRPALRQAQGAPSESRGERVEGRQSVVAAMPGRIVRVLVSPGDRVAAGQPVVVVEAMKMENEMRSPKEGVVREVSVKPGAAVDAGTVLMVIE
jgi:biotin carboxyl carrier protein